ncbi:hypothetical protein R3P38DRAFT_3150547 [Favolaschia claudopus]|uniref:CFEM domain-containing protein n=1 Tax=Favolaschia claudopus TaxID=2862362 RepID=A0AAV9Z178_9AGAR
MLFCSRVAWNTLVLSFILRIVAAQSSSSPTPTDSDGVVLPSSSAGLDPCMETCFEEAAGANGCPIDDVNCVCASAQLQADLIQCLDTECSPFAAPQAQGLLLQLCNKVRIAATGSIIPGHLSLSTDLPTPTTRSGLPALPKKNGSHSSSLTLRAYLSIAAILTVGVLGPVARSLI